MRPADVVRIAVPEEVALAPDARAVAFTVRSAAVSGNRYRSHIQIVPLSTSSFSLDAEGDWNDSGPSWSPDGARLAFLSDRRGATQVWLRSGDGAERQLTSFASGVKGQPIWSPAGTHLLVAVSEDLGQKGPASSVSRDDPPFLVTHLTYRVDGQGYLGERYQKLWIVEAGTGEATPLTSGPFDDLAPAWSPDGRWVAFVSNRVDTRLPEFRSAIWVVPMAGGEPRRITPENGVALSPAWSPDGREVACTGLLPGQPSGSNHKLLLASVDGERPPRVLTAGFEGHVGGSLFSDAWQAGKIHPHVYWTPDGDVVRFLAVHRAAVGVYEVDRASRVGHLVGGERACAMLSLSRDGRTLAYAASDFRRPPDVFLKEVDGDERRVSDLNPSWQSDLHAVPQPLAVPTADGNAVDAWLMVPSGETEPGPGPLVQYIHGGPHSVFGHVLFFDMQLLAARGYRVLFVNPRATRGYGDRFAICNLGRWGEGDAPDQLAALDAAIETGWVDRDRVGVMGLSYGGYMTNWLIAHTDRFRAAVSENGLSNLVSMCGTSDIGWYFMPEEMGAQPEEDPALYRRLSPLTAAAGIDVPLLLLACLEDWRCPIEQGEQLYTALKSRGRTVEMLCFPGESHVMLSAGRPASRAVRRAHILRWFDTHLRG